MSYKLLEETVSSISKHHFPIVGVIKTTNKCELLGTCSMLKLDNRYFLISASHVMHLKEKILNNELWLWNFMNQHKYVITEDIIYIPNENVPNWNDIAIIEIDYKYYNIPEECFIQLPRLFYNLKTIKDNKYIITGYPSSQNKKRLNPARLKLPKLFAFFTDKSKKSNINGYEELATIICLDYNNQNLIEKGNKLPKPNGMSGGGVWLLSDKSEFNPRLMAIPVYYDINNKVVNAVKIDLVLSTIKGFFKNTILDKIDLPIDINVEKGIVSIPHDLINDAFTDIVRDEIVNIYFDDEK